MEELSPAQQDLLYEIISQNGFHEFDVKISPGSAKGDNYMSITKSICIKDKKTQKVLNLFMKCALVSGQLRQQIPVNAVFRRESACYESIFPKFEELYSSKGARYLFPTFAKFYGKTLEDFNESLVMENMKAKGYRTWARTRPMDSAHIELVCRQYGKIHAFSFAIKDQKPEEFEEISSRFADLFKDFLDKDTARDGNRKRANEIIEYVNDLKIKEALGRFRDGMEEFMKSLDQERTILIHGDCWCNNILFNYEDEGCTKKPTDVCLIDWQISRMGSPVLDLSYFLCTCAPKNILDDYEKYLKVYYDSLSKMMSELGSDPETVFPFSELQRHWHKYGKFGLYMATVVLKIMVSESTEAPDLAQVADSGLDIMEALEFGTVNQEVYKKRICDVVHFLVENEML